MIHHWKDVTRAATTTAATNTEVMFDALHPCDKHSRFDRPVHALISDLGDRIKVSVPTDVRMLSAAEAREAFAEPTGT